MTTLGKTRNSWGSLVNRVCLDSEMCKTVPLTLLTPPFGPCKLSYTGTLSFFFFYLLRRLPLLLLRSDHV